MCICTTKPTSMEDLLEKGYATSAPPASTSGKTWYRGRSLNDQLLQGPDLTNPLVRVLTGFGQEPIAIMLDIEAMFHQVRARSNDCDALRFLWWQTGDLNLQPQEYKMRVHLLEQYPRQAVLASCSKKLLKITGKDFHHRLLTL